MQASARGDAECKRTQVQREQEEMRVRKPRPFHAPRPHKSPNHLFRTRPPPANPSRRASHPEIHKQPKQIHSSSSLAPASASYSRPLLLFPVSPGPAIRARSTPRTRPPATPPALQWCAGRTAGSIPLLLSNRTACAKCRARIGPGLRLATSAAWHDDVRARPAAGWMRCGRRAHQLVIRQFHDVRADVSSSAPPRVATVVVQHAHRRCLFVLVVSLGGEARRGEASPRDTAATNDRRSVKQPRQNNYLTHTRESQKITCLT